jgi:para-aminobenzoate synthetase/4-amino-4-deoxychorismate lyase
VVPSPELRPPLRYAALPRGLSSLAAARESSVLLQTSRFDADNHRSFLFVDSLRTLQTNTLDELPALFQEIEVALSEGCYVAGYLSYDCGYHFEHFPDIVIATLANTLPLAWFGVYRTPVIFDHATGMYVTGDVPLALNAEAQPLPERFAEHVELEISKVNYCDRIRRIQEYIAAGDTYQINFTDQVSVTTQLSAATAYEVLLRNQPVAYSALLNVADSHIVSLSPEMFFRTAQGRIVTRPMKGTMPRGLDTAEDAAAIEGLQSDEKNRAEHVMIVDLLRTDIGRICRMGSVRVDDLFRVETFATLLQMTSTVSGDLRAGVGWYDIFKAIFPCGSITGAPKLRTMQIIRELEAQPRGVGMGAIGYISPRGTSAFSVAIRTLVMQQGKAQMRVGGGIVADSVAEDEYRECLLKTAFLTRAHREFQLIETMLWDGELRFLPMHLDRLEASAKYFDFAFDRAAIELQLAQKVTGNAALRVRLLLHASGECSISSVAFVADNGIARVMLAEERTSSADVFLRHKTTHREQYDRCLAQARAAGCDEIIFRNERGEITEGTISNVFIRRGGKLLTPPLSCGVLPGIFRRHLLETEANAEERILTLEDLETADEILICNSLRGLRAVSWQERTTDSSLRSD